MFIRTHQNEAAFLRHIALGLQGEHENMRDIHPTEIPKRAFAAIVRSRFVMRSFMKRRKLPTAVGAPPNRINLAQ